MKLLEKIDAQEKMVSEMNHMINSLIDEDKRLTENIILNNPIGRFLLRKFAKDLIFDIRDEKVDTKDAEEKDVVKPEDVEDVIDKGEDDEVTPPDSGAKLDKISKDLNNLVDKQIALIKKFNKKGFATIIINFNDPIEFKLKRGPEKGKDLKLERTKKYDVYEISKEKTKFNRAGDYKIYFTYKQWLRDYDIMFSLIQKDIVKDVKKGETTISIVYVDRTRGEGNYRMISEEILTKRAVIEIEDVK